MSVREYAIFFQGFKSAHLHILQYLLFCGEACVIYKRLRKYGVCIRYTCNMQTHKMQCRSWEQLVVQINTLELFQDILSHMYQHIHLVHKS